MTYILSQKCNVGVLSTLLPHPTILVSLRVLDESLPPLATPIYKNIIRFMREPRAIRYFFNKEIADRACKYLQDEGFECYIIEDMFEKLTLDKVGMLRRFRLYVERDDINKIAEILAKKLRH